MIADLKPYPAMKDSGVPWLGEVPEHWEVRKLKYAVSFSGGGTPSKAEVSFWGGRIPWVSPKDMTRARIADSMDHITEEAVSASATSIVSPGALLMVVRSGILRRTIPVAINAVEVALNQDMKALRPRPGVVASDYLRALVQGNEGVLIQEWTKQGATVESIEHEFLANSLVPLPPLPEQAAIVRFLDHADRRIRRYVRAKQKLIKLLEEQKQAIIHRAVTRGLDPNVRLKPSGVEWLGDVPEHWEVLPLCAIARPRKQTNQAHRELLSVYLGRGVIPFSAVEEKRTNPTSEDLSKYQAVEVGDFVLNNQQAWRGSVGVSRHQGIVSPAYLVLALDGRLIVEFADRLLPGRAMVTQYLVSSKGVGSIQRNLYWPHLRRVAVLVPPAVEQAAIARYLDDATASLATTIERAGCEIDLLREYRTRLIADVVTGKLDVREAAARLPDEIDELESIDEPDVLTDVEDVSSDELDAVADEGEA